MECPVFRTKFSEEKDLMKILTIVRFAKHSLWLAPLSLLVAGCGTPVGRVVRDDVPVRPDATIAQWQERGWLPPTGTERPRVYSNPISYPLVYEPQIIVEGDNAHQRAGDLALGDSIRQRVAFDRGLAPSLQRVTISIQNGTLALQGTVKSDFDARIIVDSLRDMPGVTDIRNQLAINPNWD